MVEVLYNLFFTFILKCLDFFPTFDLIFEDNSIFDDLMLCIGYLNSFIGLDIFLVAFAHTYFFWTAETVWSIIEWIYNKIPGIN